MTKYVYLAGPINGDSYEKARYGWREEFSKLLSKDIIPLSPMRQEGHLKEVTELSCLPYNDHFWSKQRMVVAKDLFDVKRADVILVYLKDTSRASLGTVSEMAWAYLLGKPTVLVMEKEFEKNQHHHLFIHEMATNLVHTLEDAATIVNGLYSEGI